MCKTSIKTETNNTKKPVRRPVTVIGGMPNTKKKSLCRLVEDNIRGRQTDLPGEGVPALDTHSQNLQSPGQGIEPGRQNPNRLQRHHLPTSSSLAGWLGERERGRGGKKPK